jgi:hypothetical protein
LVQRLPPDGDFVGSLRQEAQPTVNAKAITADQNMAADDFIRYAANFAGFWAFRSCQMRLKIC